MFIIGASSVGGTIAYAYIFGQSHGRQACREELQDQSKAAPREDSRTVLW